MTNKKPFVNWVLPGIELPLHQNLYIDFPPLLLWSSLSELSFFAWAAALILPPIKLNSQLSSCTSFFVNSYGDHKGTQSGLPSFNWTPWGTRALVPAWPLAPIHLLGECRWIQVSLSGFLNLLYWLRFWVLFSGGADYLPPPSRKDTWRGMGGGRWNIWGIPTHGIDTEWGSVERYWEIPTQAKDTELGAGWKMPGELPTQ